MGRFYKHFIHENREAPITEDKFLEEIVADSGIKPSQIMAVSFNRKNVGNKEDTPLGLFLTTNGREESEGKQKYGYAQIFNIYGGISKVQDFRDSRALGNCHKELKTLQGSLTSKPTKEFEWLYGEGEETRYMAYFLRFDL